MSSIQGESNRRGGTSGGTAGDVEGCELIVNERLDFFRTLFDLVPVALHYSVAPSYDLSTSTTYDAALCAKTIHGILSKNWYNIRADVIKKYNDFDASVTKNSLSFMRYKNLIEKHRKWTTGVKRTEFAKFIFDNSR